MIVYLVCYLFIFFNIIDDCFIEIEEFWYILYGIIDGKEFFICVEFIIIFIFFFMVLIKILIDSLREDIFNYKGDDFFCFSVELEEFEREYRKVDDK